MAVKSRRNEMFKNYVNSTSGLVTPRIFSATYFFLLKMKRLSCETSVYMLNSDLARDEQLATT